MKGNDSLRATRKNARANVAVCCKQLLALLPVSSFVTTRSDQVERETVRPNAMGARLPTSSSPGPSSVYASRLGSPSTVIWRECAGRMSAVAGADSGMNPLTPLVEPVGPFSNVGGPCPTWHHILRPFLDMRFQKPTEFFHH